MRYLLIFIMLGGITLFAQGSAITLKVPVQLDKLPSNVKVNGKEGIYLLRCELRDINAHVLDKQETAIGNNGNGPFNKTVTLVFNPSGENIEKISYYFCKLYISAPPTSGFTGNAMSGSVSYTSSYNEDDIKSLNSNAIENLPPVEQIKDQTMGNIK